VSDLAMGTEQLMPQAEPDGGEISFCYPLYKFVAIIILK
jgi:hypothetical protein